MIALNPRLLSAVEALRPPEESSQPTPRPWSQSSRLWPIPKDLGSPWVSPHPGGQACSHLTKHSRVYGWQ